MSSLYLRLLGPSFERLDPRLRPYFSLEPGGSARASGVFEIAGSRVRWLRPLWAFLAWRHVLFPEFGRDVPFEVVNTAAVDGTLSAVRTFRFPGRDRVMEDSMRIEGGRLHDRLGRRRGLEVEFTATVDHGGLVLESAREWLHGGPLRIRIPALVRVRLSERWTEAGQRVEVRLSMPVLGTVFEYAGRVGASTPV
ncbi:uncharacterized protein DUF4166 [Diaminobutyricimonas aerilata]|uniref:Uncharacterized protein DUF4166 n=1 Tax=Diaminobutyricimonas aerilata TaxID=1162967 RepID=A0A2M9CMK9_9MICO|nr:DUF4166 domain-containing protein [Diaminobutyricimonas aerilata]PJJ73127.1 uncharacterized protein DUF4166 [Diaminobutyricimonas aerilata]